MNKNSISNEEWAKIKKKYSLDNEEVWMAKNLGFTPDTIRRKLVRSSNESWKDIVPLRIRRLFDKRFGTRSNLEITK